VRGCCSCCCSCSCCCCNSCFCFNCFLISGIEDFNPVNDRILLIVWSLIAMNVTVNRPCRDPEVVALKNPRRKDLPTPWRPSIDCRPCCIISASRSWPLSAEVETCEKFDIRIFPFGDSEEEENPLRSLYDLPDIVPDKLGKVSAIGNPPIRISLASQEIFIRLSHRPAPEISLPPVRSYGFPCTPEVS